MHIAVFKPYNARVSSAFYGAQHMLFLDLRRRFGHRFTYLVDDPRSTFPGVEVRHLKRARIRSLITGAYKALVSPQVRYPFYPDLDLAGFDLILSEGVRYSLLHYLRQDAERVILNDSLSWDPRFSSRRVAYLNRYFGNTRSVVVTPRVEEVYRQNGIRCPTTVIGHPIDVGAVRFRKRSGPLRRIVSVGRLVPEKGFDVIIAAAAAVMRRQSEVTLEIFGVGPLQAALQHQIKAGGMSTRIILRGQVPRERLLQELEARDLFVTHPVEIQGHAEAFLLANLEAMAAGLPVITAATGGVPYVVQDRAIVVPQRDWALLENALERFASGREDSERWSSEGRAFVESNYGLGPIGDRWEHVLSQGGRAVTDGS